MRYQALIFDMDGTIVHNMPVHNQAWQDTLAEAGVHIDQDEFNHTTTGKKTGEIIRMMIGEHVTEADIAYWGGRKEALYRLRYADRRQPLPGLLELLEFAHRKGMPMAVATAAPPENITFILDGMDLRRYFQAVIGGDDVTHGKPNPEIFLLAASALDADPAACLVFEDAPGGIEAARRAGMDAILLTTTIHPEAVAGKENVICSAPDFTHIDLSLI